MKESEFVAQAMEVARKILSSPLSVESHTALLYEISVDHRLELQVDPKDPKRGQSAFQADVVVFEEVGGEEAVHIPRVVLEFKQAISTHDAITYSHKARRHKQVYPYLRFGMIIGKEATIPNRVFKHSEAFDFLLATEGLGDEELRSMLEQLLLKEVAASHQLELIVRGDAETRFYRTPVILDE